ncbi:DUF1961 family protein [Phytoactinopolyspora halotolerans]|uniref:DUF1961 family protein n=2 Tax=Phytoactinopolyspora halotolerans TaxID=1981512 RepID=A0A6L9SCX5_9ACTN|nr:DUF1961 family protein [Phytoactinopolyspora halotolerans]
MAPYSDGFGEVLYRNALAKESDVGGFTLEGYGAVSFPLGRMRLESTRHVDDGQAANIVLWCPLDFPDDIAISWNFWPIREPGLAILFFAALGVDGRDIFDPELARRTGPYQQYHSGDINAYHISYFRRKQPTERAFHTCNLRKSRGFHLVAQGADPIPSVIDADPPYRMLVVKRGPSITLVINDLTCFTWLDDGTVGGPPHTYGKIGFRQMAPLIGEYSDLLIRRIGRGPATQDVHGEGTA